LTTRILLLTGAQRVGKTTVLDKIVDSLKARGINEGSIITREVKDSNARVGFEILDLTVANVGGWLK
jgi:nucleoside-triphosphatase THEP1